MASIKNIMIHVMTCGLSNLEWKNHFPIVNLLPISFLLFSVFFLQIEKRLVRLTFVSGLYILCADSLLFDYLSYVLK